MRQKSLGEQKRRIWFLDQYRNPHETTFTVGEVLKWFEQNNIDYINSIPKISLGERFNANDGLFEPHDRGSPLHHLLCQLGWIFTEGKEGGFFIMIGRKQCVISGQPQIYPNDEEEVLCHERQIKSAN